MNRYPTKFEALIANINECVANPGWKDRRLLFHRAIFNLFRFREELTRDSAKMKILLAVARNLREAGGPGRMRAEEMLLEHLASISSEGAALLKDAASIPKEAREIGAVLGLLLDFARECLEFNRPRDAFAAKRRAMAFQVLVPACSVFDLTAMTKRARQIVRKSQGEDAQGAVEFLHASYTSQGDAIPEEVAEELLDLADRADSRSTVFVALNALVEAGNISELQALDRMDTWKASNYYC